jgi:hypothetical protein
MVVSFSTLLIRHEDTGGGERVTTDEIQAWEQSTLI